MKEHYDNQFEEIFKSESLRGEQVHLRFNWFLYIMIFILSSLVYFLQDNIAGRYGMILCFINLLYNLFASIIVIKKKSFALVGYCTVFLNVLTLTIYNYIDACNNSSILPATSAALLLYPIIIFLASLRMDKYLIIWSSILSILAMNGLYVWFYNSFDSYFDQQPMSIDILSQVYRTFYLIIIAVFIYSVPTTMHRILKKQEQLAKESDRNKQNAQHDSLTGLYNRLYFEQYLPQCLEVAKQYNHKVALLFIDLDRFKYLNDTYGHTVGDYTLKAIAQDICSITNENHIIARIGGDEFVMIMSQVADINEVKSFSSRVLAEITRKRAYKNKEILLGASIGISIYPDDSEDMKQLIKNADKAMYFVKKSEEKGIMFYHSMYKMEKL